MTLPSQAPAWVRDYIGLPFEALGRTRAGVDCWGLVRLVYAERLQVYLPSHCDGYERVDDSEGVGRVVAQEVAQAGNWQRVEAGPKLYDVLLFAHAHGRWHVGLLVGDGLMLHASSGSDSCVEPIARREKRLDGYFRHCGPVRLIGRVAPLTPARMEAAVPAGGNVAEILVAAGITASPGLRVWLGDTEIPPEAFKRVRPRPGVVLTVSVIPEGKEGGALRILMSIAVIAAAIYAPYLAPAGWGLVSGAGAAAVVTAKGALVSAAVGIAGMLAVSALVPPPRPRLSEGSSTQSPSISGGRNEYRPWEPFSVVMGQHRISPMYGAVPFTEIAGDDQYLRMLFVVGYGPLALTALRIGDTPIEEFQGVELEIREGYETDEPITLYPGTVREQQLGVLLQEVDGWTTRTLEIDADEISVDVTWPQGLARITNSGGKQPRTCSVEVEYSPTGTGQWRRVNEDSPDFPRGMDLLFRATDAARGLGVQEGEIAWGGTWPNPKPTFLPMGGYAYELTGFIYLPTPGLYEFAIDGSDSIELFVAGKLVASWYGQHEPSGSFGAHTGTVNIVNTGLQTGWRGFKVRMESRSNNGGALAVGWKRPGDGAFSVIPAQFLRVPSQVRGIAFGPTGRLNYRWRDVSAYSSDITLREARTDTMRRSLAWAVPRGRYDVRVRRSTPDTADDRIIDKVYLTALRAILARDAVAKRGQALVAMRIKATDQLNGVVDNFNLVATSILPDWDADSQTWIQRATSSPAAAYRAVMQGPANLRPLTDGRLDVHELQIWAEECRARGLEFNGIFDTKSTVYERLSDICASGRATHGMRDGLHGVVRDRPQQTPVQHFTPRNSREYRGSRQFLALPHALRVRFLDRDLGWQQTERIVLDDGYQIDGKDAFGNDAPDLPPATVYDVLELFGCTSGEQAFKQGRYFIAVARLRPETHEITVDFEHLVCQRGDLVLLTHDVPMFGLSCGRVSGLLLDSGGNLLGIDLDEEVVMDPHDAYSVRVRLASGQSFVRPVQTVEGVHRQILFAQLVGPTDPRPEVGDLYVFGRTGQESRECLVKSIAHEADLGARLTLVDHAPDVHLADVGEIPPWDPGISRPADYIDRPETPVIENIRSDDYVMVRGSDGTLQPRMVLDLRAPSGARPIATLAQVLTRPIPTPGPAMGPYTYRPLTPILANSVSVADVEEGVTYEIRLRTVTASGKASEWTSAEHTVIGKSAPPPNVSTFGVVRLSDGTRRFSWTIADPPPDLAGVVIRYGQVSQTWGTMTRLHADVLPTSPAEFVEPPAGTWKFAIKAIDTSGNESPEALYATVTLGSQRLEGVAFQQDERLAGWPGVRTGCFIAGEILEANDLATWDALETPAYNITRWDQWTRWNLSPTSPIVYESEVLDAGFVFQFSPDVLAAGEGQLLVEVATSVDGVTWSDWEEAVQARSTSVSGRYMRGRITCAAGEGINVPVISHMLLLMRAERIEHEHPSLDTSDLSGPWRIGVGDVRLPLPPGRFTRVQSVQIAFHGSGAGRTWALIDTDPVRGPRVRLYDEAGALADATISAVIRGI